LERKKEKSSSTEFPFGICGNVSSKRIFFQILLSFLAFLVHCESIFFFNISIWKIKFSNETLSL